MNDSVDDDWFPMALEWKPVPRSITVGQYTIWTMPERKVWIRNEAGEGMACAASILEAAIKTFWAEHF